MKTSFANFLLVAITAVRVLPFVQGQIDSTIGGNFTVESSLTITGVDEGTELGASAPAGSLSGVVLSRSCILATRQAGLYIPPNGTTEQRVNFGPYEGGGVKTTAIFADYGIPNGSAIDVILDISGSSNINPDVWWIVNYTSPCVGQFTCSGSAFRYAYKLIGVTCDSAQGTVARFGQCGGQGYTGPTVCVSGTKCTVANPFFSQCL